MILYHQIRLLLLLYLPTNKIIKTIIKNIMIMMTFYKNQFNNKIYIENYKNT
jgi:hypothetical protein